MIEVCWHSATGEHRDRNEDAIVVQNQSFQSPTVPITTARYYSPLLIAVIDGMGGHPEGDVAARTAAASIAEATPFDPDAADPLLDRVLERANDAVYEASRVDRKRTAMGAVAVVCVIGSASVTIANLGDAAAFLHSHGLTSKVSTDHVSPSGAVTQCLGGTVNATTPLPSTRQVQLPTGSRLLLATDGVAGTVPFGELQEALNSDCLADAASRIVAAVGHAGSPDNLSFVLAQRCP